MKKGVCLLLIFLLPLCGCEKSDNKITGTWLRRADSKMNYGSSYTFYSDNTGKYRGATTSKFTWTVLEGGHIRLDGDWGTSEIFERVGDTLVSGDVVLKK